MRIAFIIFAALLFFLPAWEDVNGLMIKLLKATSLGWITTGPSLALIQVLPISLLTRFL